MTSLTDAAAEAVRAGRARHRLRQEDLAPLVNMSRRTVSHVEAGDRVLTLEELPVLCRVLGITLAELLAGADEEDLDALGL